MILAFLATSLAGPLVAAPVFPEGGGLSGHVTFGAGAGSAETNTVDGIAGIEVGDDRIDSLDEDAVVRVSAFLC